MRLRDVLKLLLLLLPAVLLLLPGAALPADNPAAKLAAARSLKCHFDRGNRTEWIKGKPRTSDVSHDEVVQFDSIDAKKGSARLIGSLGASDVLVVLTHVGLSFIEAAGAAFDNTTVFPVYAKGSDFIAVDLRTVQSMGKPTVEQYFGTCRVWE
jgi:hypothetical protein